MSHCTETHNNHRTQETILEAVRMMAELIHVRYYDLLSGKKNKKANHHIQTGEKYNDKHSINCC
jgi:hypothetical protein